MFLHHRAVLVIGAAAAVAVTALALHASAAPPPGPSISWASTPTASAQPSVVGGVHPIPVARSTPQASGGPLAGLQIPIAAMFRQLNSETTATAVGQYSILHSIERVLRDQLEAFLRWVTRGH